MAVAVNRLIPNADHISGNRKMKIRDLVFSGTYTAGGEGQGAAGANPITPAVLGLKIVEQAIFHGVGATDGTVGYPAHYVASTGRIKLFESGAAINTGLAEKGAESLANVTARVTFVGF